MSQNFRLIRVFLQVVVRRPGLALEALRFAAATAPTGWYRKPPFLPLPEPIYRDWRLATAYGTSDAPVTPHEMEEFLEWRRTMRANGAA
jgi:hypothetical protein